MSGTAQLFGGCEVVVSWRRLSRYFRTSRRGRECENCQNMQYDMEELLEPANEVQESSECGTSSCGC